MHFGEKLQQLRKEQNLSQEQLASQLQVSRQAISKWELGSSSPDVENVVALSRLFHVSTDYLLLDQENPPAPAQSAPSAPKSEALPLPQKAARHTAVLVVAIVLTSLGALGNLVIWVLSTMIQSYFPSATTDNLGQTWYTDLPGFSYGGFVERYNLQAIVFLLCFSLVIGLFLFYVRHCLRQDDREKTL